MPLYGVASIYNTPEGYHGWVLETLKGGFHFIPQEVRVRLDGDKLHWSKPNLDMIVKEHLYEYAERTESWIYELERIRFPHQIEALMREVTLIMPPGLQKMENADEIEQKVINTICQVERWIPHSTSKSHPLKTIGTHLDHIKKYTDVGIQPLDKQLRECRSIFKNAIYWKEGAIDEWGILKPFRVAFTSCPLFDGVEGDQPCCDMIATTPYGRSRMEAFFDFDSERMLRNAESFDCVEYESYEDVKELAPGVTRSITRYKGRYNLKAMTGRKLVSPHGLKGMEFGIDFDLAGEDGKMIDILIDIRSVESKKAWSLACAQSRYRSKTGASLNDIWAQTQKIVSGCDIIGEARVFNELFATTVENSLMVGNTQHTLKVRPEAHIVSGIGYDAYNLAIAPNIRAIQEYAQLYEATQPIKHSFEAIPIQGEDYE